MYQVIGTMKTRAALVVWALEEMGLPYELQVEQPQSDRVRALNPSGKVPVLLEGDEILTDSTAILTYLADKHAMLTFPAGTLDRARQDGLIHTLLDEFDALLWTAARHSFILPPDLRVPAIKDSLRWEFARNAARLAPRIKGPYLMGETFTIADIVAEHCLSWARAIRFAHEVPALDSYLAHVQTRPAFQRVKA
ncbi:MAG: glutathione S-transferase family protein [Rhodobacterales bacterium]|nr:glutathione S-transferase family protein [Rhodobacterales bacterium]